MNGPLTDKQRISILEMRVSELERELALVTGHFPAEIIGAERIRLLTELRRALVPLSKSAARPTALTLLAMLLERPGHTFTRRALSMGTRSSRSWTDNAETHSVDVRLSDLRRGLARMGFPRVIHHVPDCGWMIERADADRIKAALGVIQTGEARNTPADRLPRTSRDA